MLPCYPLNTIVSFNNPPVKMGDREVSIPGQYATPQAVELFSGQTAGGSARQHNGNNYNSQL